MGSICSICEETLTFKHYAKPVLQVKSTQTGLWNTTEVDQSSDLGISVEKSQKAKLALVVHYAKKHVKRNLRKIFFTWKNFQYLDEDEQRALEDLEIFEEDEHPEVKIDRKILVDAQDKINSENLQVIKECPLYCYAELLPSNKEQAMPLSSLLRFFEEMIDKKYESDTANLLIKRPLASIPDFFLDHLVRVYGLKKLAQKAMWQMMKTLKQLSEQNHSYGKIMCRLLQVYDSQPIPTQLAWFMTRAQFEFKKVLSSKKQLKIRRLEEIHLIEAVNLTYSLFETDKFSRAKAISMLKPKIMTEEEFLMFRIYNKIIRMGNTAEILFSVLDVEGTGSIQLKSFLEYIKKNLEVIMNQADVRMIQGNFDGKDSGVVSKEVFLAKLQVKPFPEYMKNEKLTISKSTFLYTLAEVYKIIQLRDTAFLSSMFTSYKKLKITQSEFSEILSKLETRLHHEQMRDYYEEAVLLNSDYSLDGVLLDALIKVVFKNGIGRRGIRDFSNQ